MTYPIPDNVSGLGLHRSIPQRYSPLRMFTRFISRRQRGHQENALDFARARSHFGHWAGNRLTCASSPCCLPPAQAHGTPWLALPLGERSILECVVETLRSANITDILIVLGPQVASLKPLAGEPALEQCSWTIKPRTCAQHHSMRPRLAGGERTARRKRSFLLPTISGCPARQLKDCSKRDRKVQRRARVTTHRPPRRPRLIGWKHVPGIRSLPANQGLNVYLRAQTGYNGGSAVLDHEHPVRLGYP